MLLTRQGGHHLSTFQSTSFSKLDNIRRCLVAQFLIPSILAFLSWIHSDIMSLDISFTKRIHSLHCSVLQVWHNFVPTPPSEGFPYHGVEVKKIKRWSCIGVTRTIKACRGSKRFEAEANVVVMCKSPKLAGVAYHCEQNEDKGRRQHKCNDNACCSLLHFKCSSLARVRGVPSPPKYMPSLVNSSPLIRTDTALV